MKFILIILFISSFAHAKQTIYEDLRVEGTASANRIESTVSSNPCPSYSQASIDALSGSVAGDCVFNTTTQNLNVFDGTIWKSAGGGLSMWASGKVFNLNDVVVYDNAIYRCISAHTSIASFEPVNWVLISGDTILNDIQAKKIEADKVIQTANNTLKIETDSDNLLVNGGFEAQDVTLGWVKSTDTSIDFIDVGTFEGKKSRAIRFGGAVANYRAEANRPEYIGRQARVEIYYKSDITWGAEVPEICVYAGTASNVVSGTCEPLQNTGTQWYPYQKGFFWPEAVMGLVIRNNGAIDLLNYVYLDKASIKLDKNEGFVANIEGDYQSETLLNVGNLTQTTNLASFSTADVKNSGSLIYTKSTAGITLLRDAYVSTNYFIGIASGGGVVVNNTFVNGVFYAGNGGATSYRHTSGISQFLKKGDVITFEGGGNTATYSKVTIYATARSQVTVFPDETFSTDINPVYWKATACGESEIGCYNTYPFTSGTNDKGVICSTRPTQTDADIRINGPILYTRLYSQAGTCNQPLHYEFILPKGLSTPSVNVFKSAGKVDQGMVEYAVDNAGVASGILFKEYNKTTGRFVLSNGVVISGNIASRGYLFAGAVRQAHAYTPFSASKTGLGMANVPARYPVKVSPPEMMPSWYIVYNDGWVEQAGHLPVGTVGVTPSSLLISMKDTLYTLTPSVENLTSFNDAVGGLFSSYTGKTTSTVSMWRSAVISRPWTVSGYGASSVVKQYGANPAY